MYNDNNIYSVKIPFGSHLNSMVYLVIGRNHAVFPSISALNIMLLMPLHATKAFDRTCIYHMGHSGIASCLRCRKVDTLGRNSDRTLSRIYCSSSQPVEDNLKNQHNGPLHQFRIWFLVSTMQGPYTSGHLKLKATQGFLKKKFKTLLMTCTFKRSKLS